MTNIWLRGYACKHLSLCRSTRLWNFLLKCQHDSISKALWASCDKTGKFKNAQSILVIVSCRMFFWPSSEISRKKFGFYHCYLFTEIWWGSIISLDSSEDLNNFARIHLTWPAVLAQEIVVSLMQQKAKTGKSSPR